MEASNQDLAQELELAALACAKAAAENVGRVPEDTAHLANAAKALTDAYDVVRRTPRGGKAQFS